MENIEENKVQKLLNKYIADEIVSYNFYKASIAAVKQDEKQILVDLFEKMADDEYTQHYEKLLNYALQNGFDVPFKFSEYEKYANKKVLKFLNGLKRGESAPYYIDMAAQLESVTIESYADFLNAKESYEEGFPYAFTSILWQNFYDEKEHCNIVLSLSDAYKNGAVYSIYQ